MAIKPDQDGGPVQTGLWNTKGTVKLTATAVEISVAGLADASLYRVTGWLDPTVAAIMRMVINDQAGAIYDSQTYVGQTTPAGLLVNNDNEWQFHSGTQLAETGFQAWIFQPVVGNPTQHALVGLIQHGGSGPTQPMSIVAGIMDGYNAAITKIAVGVTSSSFAADSFIVVEEATQ